LLTVFGYCASSICITVVLAGFLAILFDPVVVVLEKLHLPPGVAAVGIVRGGISLIGVEEGKDFDLREWAALRFGTARYSKQDASKLGCV
jgi:hypothetical protein